MEQHKDRQSKLVIIIPARNEEKTIVRVIQEAKKLNPDDIVVVVNGSQDQTATLARKENITVVEFPDALGHDVGRAVGAGLVSADIYLFIDGDFVIPANDLKPFVQAIDNGIDLALNRLQDSPPYPPMVARFFVNWMMDREDLNVSSVTTVPHAISKRLLDQIGKESLVNPMLAHVKAIMEQFNVQAVHFVDVRKGNRLREHHIPRSHISPPLAYELSQGDAVEALDHIGKNKNEQSLLEKRTAQFNHLMTNILQIDTGYLSPACTMILVIKRHTPDLENIIQHMYSNGVEMILFVNQELTELTDQLKRKGITFVPIDADCSTEACFAAGAKVAKGYTCLFHVTDVPMSLSDLELFLSRTSSTIPNLRLYDQSKFLRSIQSMHPIHLGNCFMNNLGRQEHLTCSSMLLPPYSLNQTALQKLKPESLMFPVLSHMKALHYRFQVDLLHVRTPQNAVINRNSQEVIDDFWQGILFWTGQYGKRGGFEDLGRKRTIVIDWNA